MGVLQRIVALLTGFGIFVAVILAGFLAWISLRLVPPVDLPQELALLAVLGITMGSVIIAAFITAAIHRLLDGPGSVATPGVVFRESIKRYAWLAAPIAGGYGVAQIVARVAEIIAQAP